MQKVTTPIKNLELIEEELKTGTAGVLALLIDEERVIQMGLTFVYLDKNIFFYIENEDLYQKIKFGAHVSFTVIRNEKTRRTTKLNFTPLYHLTSISIYGVIEKPDEQKRIDEIRNAYISKYSKTVEPGSKIPVGQVVMIDSLEFQAFEEIGG